MCRSLLQQRSREQRSLQKGIYKLSLVSITILTSYYNSTAEVDVAVSKTVIAVLKVKGNVTFTEEAIIVLFKAVEIDLVEAQPSCVKTIMTLESTTRRPSCRLLGF